MKYFLTVSLFFIAYLSWAQVKHTIQPKETYYSITKKYNVTEAQLLEANPFLKNRGLQPGDVLTIPSAHSKSNSDYVITGKTKVVKEENGYYYIQIGEKETLYNLTRTFKITEEIIKKHNPQVSEKGLIVNDILKIPGKSPKIIESETSVVETPKEIKNTPKETKIIAEDDEYVTFEIGDSETLESFSEKYGISIRKIVKENEFLEKNTLKTGDNLKIPNTKKLQNRLQAEKEIANQTKTTKVLSENEEYYFIETGKNENYKSLCEKFNTTEKAIKEHNSFLGNDAILEGFTLKIPKKTTSLSNSKNLERQKDDTIQIVFLLPFELNNREKTGGKIASTNFLSGCKFALDSIMHQGKKLKVRMFDISTEEDLNSAFTQLDFSKTDLVIGPFKNAFLDIAAKKLIKWNVPIFSPISTKENLVTQPNVIIGKTDDKLLIDALVQEIKNNYTNQVIYLFAKTNESELLDYTKKGLQNLGITNSNISIINSASDIIIPQNIMTEKYQDIIPVLLSEDKTFCREFIKKLEELDFNLVTPYALGYSYLFDTIESVKIFQKTGFTYIYNEKADLYNQNTARTLKLFEKSYCDSPDRYAVQGFDTTYDMLSRMDNSGNIFNWEKENQHIAYKYQYQQTENNGAMYNKAYRITKINRNTD